MIQKRFHNMKHRKNKSHTVIQYLITTVFFAKQAKKCLHFPGNLIESMLKRKGGIEYERAYG